MNSPVTYYWKFWIFKNFSSHFRSLKFIYTSMLWKYVIDNSCTFHLPKTRWENTFSIRSGGGSIWWCHDVTWTILISAKIFLYILKGMYNDNGTKFRYSSFSQSEVKVEGGREGFPSKYTDSENPTQNRFNKNKGQLIILCSIFVLNLWLRQEYMEHGRWRWASGYRWRRW